MSSYVISAADQLII